MIAMAIDHRCRVMSPFYLSMNLDNEMALIKRPTNLSNVSNTQIFSPGFSTGNGMSFASATS